MVRPVFSLQRSALILSGSAAIIGCSGIAAAQGAPPQPDAPMPALERGIPDAEDFPALLDSDGQPLAWPEIASENGADAVADAGDVRYTVSIEGLGPLRLDDEFRGLSALWTRRNEPANLAQINRRTVEDRDLIDILLRSIGHYGSDTEIEVTPPVRPADPTAVAIAVTPGPLYRFSDIEVKPQAGASPETAELARLLLGIEPGDPVIAAQVIALEEGLGEKLADAGYPFPQISAPQIVIDHATRSATLVQGVDAGPRGIFGETRIEGETQGFTPRHMRVLTRYKPGDTYDGALREDLRQALVQTGLFGGVSVTPEREGEPAADGTQTIAMVARVEGAPLRTVSALGGYNTGQGVRVEGGWTHRNFFPPEGALTGRVVAAQREQLVAAEIRRRNFRYRDQTLFLGASVSTEQQFAYRARTATIGASITRESNLIWQKPITFSLGTEVLLTRQLDRSLRSATEDPNATFLIFAIPGSITLDGSDNLRDPSRGFRITTRISPEFTLRQGRNFNYVRAQLDGTYYQPVGERTVLAARLHMGTIIGANRGRVAPSRRFYAGGGGSVRGFNFQGVGPVDETGAPTGGNSITEASIEARFRFRALGNDIGIVPFVDAGQVYQGTLPSFNSLRIGAGVGLRYYTAFGPVRIDVATPITREARDPRVAFYVSIGQSF
ncbi:autotransporter assembly complex protein TamA [Polymorphobacter sp.]|uniref:autotransporter assembly complex protein TamA n=1 Tax=Polymorphobacter sp. TaxID=1909290 RepID=UPI003F72B183